MWLRDRWVLTLCEAHNTDNCSVHLGLGKEKLVKIQRMRFKLRPADSAKHLCIFNCCSLSFAFSIGHGQPDQELVRSGIVQLLSMKLSWLIPAYNNALHFKEYFITTNTIIINLCLLLLSLGHLLDCLPSPFISHSAYSLQHFLVHRILALSSLAVPCFSVLSEGTRSQ